MAKMGVDKLRDTGMNKIKDLTGVDNINPFDVIRTHISTILGDIPAVADPIKNLSDREMLTFLAATRNNGGMINYLFNEGDYKAVVEEEGLIADVIKKACSKM